MARIGEWIDTTRNLGPAAAPVVLNAWVGQREAMNKEGQIDPVALAEQEAKVRGEIARLRRAQLEYASESGKQASSLSVAILNNAGRVQSASIGAAAKRSEALIGYRGKLAEAQARTQQTIEDKENVRDPLMKAALGGSYRTAEAAGVDTNAQVKAVERLIEDQRAASGNPKKGSLQHDGLVTVAIESLEQHGNTRAAQELAEKYGAAKGESWDDYMRSAHAGITDAQIEREMKEAEKYPAGGSYAGIVALGERLDKGAGEESSGVKMGGTVAPPPEVEKQIKDLEDMADGLAKMRAEAALSGARGVNSLIYNPNQVSDTAALRRARLWGANAPGYNEEVAAEVQRHGGSAERAAKAIAERGGLSSENAIDVAPVLLGGDVVPPPMDWTGTKYGDGGWTYTFKADGTIDRTDKTGKVWPAAKPGSKEHAAIVHEFAKAATVPEGVRDLYAKAEARALLGDFAAAKREAEAVDPGLVRSAWASALRSAAKEGKGAAFVLALPGDQAGAWVEHARKIVATPGREKDLLRLADSMDAAEGAERAFNEPDYTQAQIERAKANPALAYMEPPILDMRMKPEPDRGEITERPGEPLGRPTPSAPLRVGGKPTVGRVVMAGDERIDADAGPLSYLPPAPQISDAGFDAALRAAGSADVDDSDFDSMLDEAVMVLPKKEK